MSKKLTFLILSGPTKEYIDTVRYISNESSGKMGLALAGYAVKKGYKVIFISGEVKKYPKRVELVKVTTALEMFKASKFNLQTADIIISVAAVADYRPAKFQKHKIKKGKTIIFLFYYSSFYRFIVFKVEPYYLPTYMFHHFSFSTFHFFTC